MKTIKRNIALQRIEYGLKHYPITAILGPRQCGKTTLAKMICAEKMGTFIDLEDPMDRSRLHNPKLALGSLTGLVVLDEFQIDPDLSKVLRVLADRRPLPCRFLILGSASPDLIKNSSESLAGRIHFVDLSGFTLEDVGSQHQKQLWLRGGFPISFLKEEDEDSYAWRENFIRTFLERDIPQLGISIPAATLRKFWMMVAHYHGQIWSSSEVGRSIDVSHLTAKRYLDILTGAYVVRQLQPWFENLGKRMVKSPKVYIRDSGLLHRLLDIPSWHALESHPKLGASWEGFALAHVLDCIGERNAYFWATQSGAELDLFTRWKGKRLGFEFKYTEKPTTTKSMHVAMTDLKLHHLYLVYPGSERFPLHKKITVIPLQEIRNVLT